MDTLLQDLRFAARMLAKAPLFTSVAALTLALGIGANAAVFSLADAFLLRPMPVKDPYRLVRIQRTGPRGRATDGFPLGVFQDLRDRQRSLAGLFAYDDSTVNVTIGGQTELVSGDFVSGSYFDVLGVAAILGRTFTLADDGPGKAPVAVISHAYWQRRFGKDPLVLGRTVTLGPVVATIVGVTPEGFFGRKSAGTSAALVLPMSLQPRLSFKDHDEVHLMARLAPGVSLEQAAADLSAIYRAAVPPVAAGSATPRILLAPSPRGVTGDNEQVSGSLRALGAVVGIALLIACVNVAILLLARGSARRQEITMRLALGASRGRLIRQLLTEGLLLGLLGAGTGLLLAIWSVRGLLAVLAYGQGAIPFDFKLDTRLLAFTGAVSLLAVILAALAPAVSAARSDPNLVLKGPHGQAPLRSRRRPMSALVIAQVALSLILLIGSGLMIRSLDRLYGLDLGYQRDRVLVGWVFPVLAGYDRARELDLYRELPERLAAVPGVESASVARLRLTRGAMYPEVWREGPAAPEADGVVYCNLVGPRFFTTMGIPVKLGRDLASGDLAAWPKVAVVSESFARRFFPGESPIGRRFGFDGPGSRQAIEIVGVAGDIRHRFLNRRSPLEAAFIPYTQGPARGLGQMNVLVRTAEPPGAPIFEAVRQQVRALDGHLAFEGVEPQGREIDHYLGEHKAVAVLLSFFAGLALLLTAIGLYATMAHAVRGRTREVGIRMALGAHRTDVLRMVLGEALALVAVGAGLGIPLALAASRVIASMLFEVGAADPPAILLATLMLLLVALAASYLPARLATRVDPILALRCE